VKRFKETGCDFGRTRSATNACYIVAKTMVARNTFIFAKGAACTGAVRRPHAVMKMSLSLDMKRFTE
jgi:hypothetical protein